MQASDILTHPIEFVSVGAPLFADDLREQLQTVVQLDWMPPLFDEDQLREASTLMASDFVQEANAKAARRILGSRTQLIDVAPAEEVIDGMHRNLILHAGPPVSWEEMCGPMQGAVIGALLFEGQAHTEEEARALAASGQITFAPCHEYQTVGPMAGVVSASMPVHVVVNETYGNRAFCTINEGLGKVLRFGAFDESVLKRLRWIRDEFAPALGAAVRRLGGIDTTTLMAQALQMGDECHNRNKAATALFLKEVAISLFACDLPLEAAQDALCFMAQNEHYFLNLSMPSCKAAMDAAVVPGSTLVTAMARNGVEFGLRISGLGDAWFTGPAQAVEGLLFPGFTEDDAVADLGDSAITETLGIGGFAMGASPAIVQFVGGTVDDALAYTRLMDTITETRNPAFALPALDFQGTPTGIDLLKVIESGTLPVINTGIAHKQPGIGQVGAGIARPPKECFEAALKAFWQRYGA